MKAEDLFEAMGPKYSMVALTISFLKFMKYGDGNWVEKAEKRLEEVYPPILVLMNINGCLVHRTSQPIRFNKPEKKGGRDERFLRWVTMFKHRSNFHYFRDGYMEFLTKILCHPRVKFAFYSSIMRKNIFPII
jgi:hypothetical protein